MPITNVVSRLGSTKREITTHIVEFYLSERDRPYRLYVNTATDAEGLVSELIDLAKVISRPTKRSPDALPPCKKGESHDFGVSGDFCLICKIPRR